MSTKPVADADPEQERVDMQGRDPDLARQVQIGPQHDILDVGIRIPVIANLVIESHLRRGPDAGGVELQRGNYILR